MNDFKLTIPDLYSISTDTRKTVDPNFGGGR